MLVQPCLRSGFLAALAQIICFSTADGNADREDREEMLDRSVVECRPSYCIPEGSSAFWELAKRRWTFPGRSCAVICWLQVGHAVSGSNKLENT